MYSDKGGPLQRLPRDVLTPHSLRARIAYLSQSSIFLVSNATPSLYLIELHHSRIALRQMELQKIPPSLTIDEIIERCRAPGDYLIAGKGFSNHVVHIDQNWVVKNSVTPSRAEARAQHAARQLLDLSLVYVPQVYSYFEHNGHGYIVMEHVLGHRCAVLSDPQLVKLRTMIDHLHSHTRLLPGTLGGGRPDGMVFENYDPQVGNKSISEWFSIWSRGEVVLTDLPQVLCHLDLAPRNIIWKSDGIPCLLDWASAGYYPRALELSSQLLMEGREGAFNKQLIEALSPTEAEETFSSAVLHMWSLTQIYSR